MGVRSHAGCPGWRPERRYTCQGAETGSKARAGPCTGELWFTGRRDGAGHIAEAGRRGRCRPSTGPEEVARLGDQKRFEGRKAICELGLGSPSDAMGGPIGDRKHGRLEKLEATEEAVWLSNDVHAHIYVHTCMCTCVYVA